MKKDKTINQYPRDINIKYSNNTLAKSGMYKDIYMYIGMCRQVMFIPGMKG